MRKSTVGCLLALASVAFTFGCTQGGFKSLPTTQVSGIVEDGNPKLKAVLKGPNATFWLIPATAVAAMAIVIHALTTGDWVGALMNLVATLGYILPAAIVYQKMHTYKGAVIGLVLGVIAATALSMVANLTIGVWFWYGSVDVIAPLMIPAVLPFNLIKTVLNSVLTLAVYKAVSNLITPKKDQVKGRA